MWCIPSTDRVGFKLNNHDIRSNVGLNGRIRWGEEAQQYFLGPVGDIIRHHPDAYMARPHLLLVLLIAGDDRESLSLFATALRRRAELPEEWADFVDVDSLRRTAKLQRRGPVDDDIFGGEPISVAASEADPIG